MIEFIHYLSGKKLSGLVAPLKLSISYLGSSHDESIKELYKYYQQVITIMSSHGAMLSSVRPEFLLSKKDYKRYITMEVLFG